jgi:exonuclease III
MTQEDASSYALSLRFKHGSMEPPWWISVVYGPQGDHEKLIFLDELQDIRAAHVGPWLLCGDFNLIYKASDKNNAKLNRCLMRVFRSFLQETELAKLHLHGRLYTWSSEQVHPPLSRIDRAFVCSRWLELYSHHLLRAASTLCSDHAPLLLHSNTLAKAMHCFKFESIWPRFPSFLEAVAEGWSRTLQNADACHILDFKLRNIAKCLQR